MENGSDFVGAGLGGGVLWGVAGDLAFCAGIAQEKLGLVNNIVSGILLILFTLASSRNGLMRIFIVLLCGWLYGSAFGWAAAVGKDAYMWNDLLTGVAALMFCVASETPYPAGYRARE